MAGGPAAPAALASSSESSSGTTYVTAAVAPSALGHFLMLCALFFFFLALSCADRVLTVEVIVRCGRFVAFVRVGVAVPGGERDLARVLLNAPTQAPQVQIRSREPATPRLWLQEKYGVHEDPLLQQSQDGVG